MNITQYVTQYISMVVMNTDYRTMRN